MTETVSVPPSGQHAPIRDPAESGPSSGRLELGLTRTNEPVPAPIESIRTSGMFRTKRAMSGVWVISKRPSVISAMSKDVPPMSVQSTLRRPILCASACPPTTPPTGPETSVRPSSLASIETVPPWAAITRSSNGAPFALVTSRTAFNVAREGSAAYASITVEFSRGRSRPHRIQLGGEEDGDRSVDPAPGLLGGDDLGHPPLVEGIAVGEQQRDDDALHALVEQLARRLRPHPARAAAAPRRRTRRCARARPSSARAGRAARCGSGSPDAGDRSRRSRGRSGCRAPAAGSPRARR